MITNNFKKYLSAILESNTATSTGLVPVVTTNNSLVYLTTNFNNNNVFPRLTTTTHSTSANSAGIVFGYGTSAATVNDYKIENPHTTGISVTVTQVASTTESNDPQLKYTLVVTNTGASAISISEIAYNQTVNAATSYKGTSISSYVVCFDRTVLETPITLNAGSTCVLEYVLKTTI